MSDEIKIYTRTGDQGQTSLIGGARVSKNDPRIEAYGTLDELNSFLGLVRDYMPEEQLRQDILFIQDRIFIAESLLAVAMEEALAYLPSLQESDITFLEGQIDEMDKKLPPLRSFVLPGGHPAVSHTHVARTVCRRAERLVIGLSDHVQVDERIIRYLNRLSDYLFTLSRLLSQLLDVNEIEWKPSKA